MSLENPYQSPVALAEERKLSRSPLWLPGWGIFCVAMITAIAMPVVGLVLIPLEASMQHRTIQSFDIFMTTWQFLMAIGGIAGSICMLRMSHRRLVLATPIFACIPYFGIAGGCFTAAFGVIALLRLRRAEVWHGFLR